MKGFSLDRIKISYIVIVNNTYIFMNLLFLHPLSSCLKLTSIILVDSFQYPKGILSLFFFIILKWQKPTTLIYLYSCPDMLNTFGEKLPLRIFPHLFK